MKNEIGKKSIVSYLLWTFGISCGVELLLIVLEKTILFSLPEGVRLVITYTLIGFGVGMAPTYASAIVLKKSGQINSFKDYCGYLFQNMKSGRTMIVVLLFSSVFVAMNILLNQWLGNAWYLAIAAIPLMIIGGGLEEAGWRGILQPALEEKLSFIPATTLVGIIWAVWHYPLWLVQGANQSAMNMISFTCSCIAIAFLLGAVYKLTKSVFACVLIHAWSNALGAVFSLDDLNDPINMKSIIIYLLLIVLSIIIYYTVNKKQEK
jgi:membrane protease YdiL (CAAX protease family)